MAPTDIRFLDMAALTKNTGRSRRTIRRWFAEGLLPRRKLGGLVGCFEHELLCALGVDDDGRTANPGDESGNL